MLNLLEDVKSGKIDRILFIKLDRWFRNVSEYHKVQSVLDDCGVTWQAIMEDYDTATAGGRLNVNIMLSVAENEADRTSERISFVLGAKRCRKEYCIPGNIRPFGYMPQVIDGVKRCVKDPETEPIVSDFFDYVTKYQSVRKAHAYIQEKYGIVKTYRNWMRIFRNELYTGTFHGVPDYCPAYIDRSTWESLLHPRMMVKKTQRPNRIYIFTGLIRCPCCGSLLSSPFKTVGGREYRGYRCNRGESGDCTYRHYISELSAEKYLLANIRSEIERFIFDPASNKSQKPKKTRVYDVVKLNEQLRRLNVIFLSGSMSDDEYTAEAKRLNAEIAKAREQDAADAPVDTSVLEEFLKSNALDIYDTFSPENRRRMWRSIIKELHVSGTQISDIIFRA